MLMYVVRRGAVSVGLIFVVITLIFAFLRLIPGDPAELLLSGGGSTAPSPESVAALRHELGLDEPVVQQYATYLGRLARLDLGRSFQDRRSVSADVAQRLPRTLELIAVATALSLLIGIPLGVVAATHRGGFLDGFVSVLASGGIAIPVFVVGTLLVLVFAQGLGWLPAGGYANFAENPTQHMVGLILPSVSIAFGMTAIVVRMTRSAVLEVLGLDFVRTAHAKGLADRRTLLEHVLPNALPPVVTVVGLQMGGLLGGTVLVEYVFNWPGLSSLLVQSASQRDYPVVQGIVLVISVLFIGLNLAVDLTYSALDPRIRYR